MKEIKTDTYRLLIYNDGSEEWRDDKGRMHRLDGPAIKCSTGTEVWYFQDCFHRIGGPAFTYRNIEFKWYQYGKLHNTEGPAVIWADGTKEWWLFGHYVTKEQWEHIIKEKALDK